jgi:hypothetical protein
MFGVTKFRQENAMRKYNLNGRSYIEREVIDFLENENPKSIDSIIEHLNDKGVTLEDNKIKQIIGYLEISEKVLVIGSKTERYKLTINPDWDEIAATKERVEYRRYQKRSAS